MLIQRVLTTFAVCLSLSAAPALAQNPFAPVVQVNEDVVTTFEIQQRELLLRIISPTNSGLENARREVINDKLRGQAVRQAGLQLSEQDIDDGIVEFAGRANLEADQFLTLLDQRGVAPETFRTFIGTSLAWRDLIRARFGRQAQITSEEIDRALRATSGTAGVRVLLSEIIIPAPPQRQQAVLAQAQRIAQSTTEAEFSSFARRFSATASRGRGGRMDWTPLSNLPAPLRPLVLNLSPGEVTSPIPLQNAVALFQLRAIEETDTPAVEFSAIEYAQFFIPGGRTDATIAEAERLRTRVDVCDDLYGIAKDLPEERLLRETKAPGDIAQDIAIELAKLDDDEVSTALVSADGQSLVFLMMCGRTAAANQDVSREQVEQQLRQTRLSGLADGLLEELRADARIRNK